MRALSATGVNTQDLLKGSKHAGSPKWMGSTKLHGWGIKRAKLQSYSLLPGIFLTQICPRNSWCLQSLFAKPSAVAYQVTQRRALSPGYPGSPHGWGWWGGCIPQNPTGEDGCQQQHHSPGVLPNWLWLSKPGCSVGRAGAGSARRWGQGQLWSTQPASHPQCLQCTAAAGPHYKGASAAAHGLAAMPGSGDILQVHFLWCLQAQARFCGI